MPYSLYFILVEKPRKPYLKLVIAQLAAQGEGGPGACECLVIKAVRITV